MHHDHNNRFGQGPSANYGKLPTHKQPSTTLSLSPMTADGAPQIPSRAPVVPSRNAGQSYLPNVNSYGGIYGSGLYSPYGYGHMGGFGAYGMYGNNPLNTFNNTNLLSQMADQQLRPAFQSMFGVVQAFTSVATMIESSFMAVYSSVQAVIGVADHFVRLRNHLASIIASLTVLRMLRRFIQKILFILGVTSTPPSQTSAGPTGDTPELGAARAHFGSPSNRSNWPVLLFFAVVVGAPLIVWRLLNSVVNIREGADWLVPNEPGCSTTSTNHYTALAQYAYQAQNDDELTIRPKQVLIVAPKDRQPTGVQGWLLAATKDEFGERRIGLVPANHIKLVGRQSTTAENLASSDTLINMDQPSTTTQSALQPELDSRKQAGAEVPKASLTKSQSATCFVNSSTNTPADSQSPQQTVAKKQTSDVAVSTDDFGRFGEKSSASKSETVVQAVIHKDPADDSNKSEP